MRTLQLGGVTGDGEKQAARRRLWGTQFSGFDDVVNVWSEGEGIGTFLAWALTFKILSVSV